MFFLILNKTAKKTEQCTDPLQFLASHDLRHDMKFHELSAVRTIEYHGSYNFTFKSYNYGLHTKQHALLHL